MGNDKSKHHPPKTTCPCDPLINAIRHEDKNAKIPQKRFWRDWEPIEKFTLIIAIFTIIYSLITYCIYDISKKNMIIGQRAFITTQKVVIRGASGIKFGVKPIGKPQVIVHYENSGQTPARKVIADFFYYRIRSREPEEFDFQRIPDSKVISEGALVGPKDDYWFSHDIPPDNLIDIQNKKTLFVYGQISYFDIFKTRHITRFCFKSYRYTLNAVDGTIIDYIFHRCEKHNCDDEYCNK